MVFANQNVTVSVQHSGIICDTFLNKTGLPCGGFVAAGTSYPPAGTDVSLGQLLGASRATPCHLCPPPSRPAGDFRAEAGRRDSDAGRYRCGLLFGGRCMGNGMPRTETRAVPEPPPRAPVGGDCVAPLMGRDQGFCVWWRTRPGFTVNRCSRMDSEWWGVHSRALGSSNSTSGHHVLWAKLRKDPKKVTRRPVEEAESSREGLGLAWERPSYIRNSCRDNVRTRPGAKCALQRQSMDRRAAGPEPPASALSSLATSSLGSRSGRRITAPERHPNTMHPWTALPGLL